MKRDAQGRFLPGNKGGPGNPFGKRVANLRKALMDAVTEDDLTEVVESLITKAKNGDIAAIKVLFDRLFGPPIAADLLERIEQLEQQITGGGT
jgi:ribosomal protein L17